MYSRCSVSCTHQSPATGHLLNQSDVTNHEASLLSLSPCVYICTPEPVPDFIVFLCLTLEHKGTHRNIPGWGEVWQCVCVCMLLLSKSLQLMSYTKKYYEWRNICTYTHMLPHIKTQLYKIYPDDATVNIGLLTYCFIKHTQNTSDIHTVMFIFDMLVRMSILHTQNTSAMYTHTWLAGGMADVMIKEKLPLLLLYHFYQHMYAQRNRKNHKLVP